MSFNRLCVMTVTMLAATVAWIFLAQDVQNRTADGLMRERSSMEQVWGGRQMQSAPSLSVHEVGSDAHADAQDAAGEQDAAAGSPKAELTSANVRVDIRKRFQRKGLARLPTYDVEFDARYTARHYLDTPAVLGVRFEFASPTGVLDEFEFTVGGREAERMVSDGSSVELTALVEPGEQLPLHLHYETKGMTAWQYSFGAGVVEVRDFLLRLTTDIDEYGVPELGIPPTVVTNDGGRATLEWRFRRSLLGRTIGIAIKEGSGVGTFVVAVTRIAPLGFLLFSLVLLTMAMMWQIDMHPAHYAFLAAGYFSFHLLLVYLAECMPIHAAFWLAAAFSVSVVGAYLWRVGGASLALIVGLPAQLVFMVFFSYVFFLGTAAAIAIVVASAIALAILTHVTADVDWEEMAREQLLALRHAPREPAE